MQTIKNRYVRGHNSITKISRRIGVHLLGVSKYLKVNPPGAVGGKRISTRRRRISEYGTSIIERKKVLCFYHIRTNAQLRKLCHRAVKQTGNTKDNLINLLESRLQNVLWRSGLMPSQKASRQIIAHNHVTVNGQRVNIRSYCCKVGDEIAIVKAIFDSPMVTNSLAEAKNAQRVASWLKVKGNKCTIVAKPCLLNCKFWVPIELENLLQNISK